MNTATPMPPYDCTSDVMEHKRKVEFWLADFARRLEGRAVCHDDSKLRPPEKECFDRWVPELQRRTFGTDEYKQALDAMGEGLRHHYSENSHHPEHFANGVNGMTLIDLVEMFCDWLAASQARNMPVHIDHATLRFGISPQLEDIFVNTLREIDVLNEIGGVPVVYLTPENRRPGK